MSNDDLRLNSSDLNDVLRLFNNFMLEQADYDDYDLLVKGLLLQMDRLLNPIATIFNEYDHDNRVLSVKEIKANKGILDLVIQAGGRKILSTVTPVDDQLYKEITKERVALRNSLSEMTAGAIPEIASKAIGKALNIKCGLGFAFMLEERLYGTMIVLLNETPQDYYLELFRTYAYFTTSSLKRIKSDQALVESERQYRSLVENLNEVVYILDTEAKIKYISPNVTELSGYNIDEVSGMQFIDFVHPEDQADRVAQFLKVMAGISEATEYRFIKKDGTIVWIRTMGKPIYENEKVVGVQGVLTDITDRKQAEEELQFQAEILDSIGDYVTATDPDGRILYVNEAECRTFGKKRDDLIGKTTEVYGENPEHGALQKEIVEATNKKGYWRGEVVNYDKDNNPIYLDCRTWAMRNADGVVHTLIGISSDITERKQVEKKIRYLGYHDQLTDLYNRYYFEDSKEGLKDIPQVSVIMTDINGLKLVNDTYGHEAGDELLKKYAKLLRQSFKQSDLFFRWGGDEFIVILKNTGEAESWELCNRLIKHCGKTFVKDIPLSVSVGLSSKFKGEDIDKAIREAEDMMYKNKLNESRSNKNLIMKTLLLTLSEKSFETKEHIDRMSLLGRQFGERLRLPPSELSRLETLTMLHDIGKINIDGHILLKETALTGKEWEEIKKHPEVGYRITRTTEEFAYIAEEILSHHERWDGSGYPQGLEGENIPYLARLLNIIDSYDVMSNGRPYKKKMTREEIIEEIESCSGKQFDPDLAGEFIGFLRNGCLDLSEQ